MQQIAAGGGLMASPAAAARGLRAALAGARNLDGGWGYYPGKQSRIEPTCWGLLGESSDRPGGVEAAVLSRWPLANGWLVDVAGAPVNYAFQALAGLLLAEAPAGRQLALDLARQLLDVRGVTFERSPVIRQDNSLQAWPWIADTFSWVEPTSLCLLLVKKLRGGLDRLASERIEVGERMLLDRACTAGGWNYGGSNVYGQELYPYVPTTALALLALQDRRSEPAVTRAVERLRQDAATEPTAQALSWASIALTIHGHPARTLERELTDEAPRALAAGNVVGLAMNVYSLTRLGGPHGVFVL